VHVGDVARRRGLSTWDAAPSRSRIVANSEAPSAGGGSDPAVRAVGAVSNRAICTSNRSHFRNPSAVGSPEVCPVFFLTGFPVFDSLLPCQFSATKSARPGGLGPYQASVCPNLFWQREAEL
jgi:hypothetical protein